MVDKLTILQKELEHIVFKYTDLDNKETKEFISEIMQKMQEYSAGEILEYVLNK